MVREWVVRGRLQGRMHYCTPAGCSFCCAPTLHPSETSAILARHPSPPTSRRASASRCLASRTICTSARSVSAARLACRSATRLAFTCGKEQALGGGTHSGRAAPEQRQVMHLQQVAIGWQEAAGTGSELSSPGG